MRRYGLQQTAIFQWNLQIRLTGKRSGKGTKNDNMSETISASAAAKSSVQQTFTSTTLQALANENNPYHSLLPLTFPVCANCPNAVWMVVDSEMLQCFCTIMHTASWKSTERNPIPLCDGIMVGADEEQS